MNWIKENKIKIIIIVAVVLLAGVGTVIALNTKQTKINPADSNQSDVVINESSKEDVTTKKDDVIKESESTTEADKEEETTSKDDKNVEEETTPAAAEPTTPYVAPPTKPQVQPTTPYVAPTTKPQAQPTKPQAKPTTPQPTRPTEPATTAPVIHGKDGVILDTLYLYKSDGGKEKVPETQDELGGVGHGKGIKYDTEKYSKNLFGVGLVLGASTRIDVEAYFGKPINENIIDDNVFTIYKYKDTELYIVFDYFKSNQKIKMVFIDGDFSDLGF